MKTPTPRKLPSGKYNVQLRLNGQSISITAPTVKECNRQAALAKAEYLSGKTTISKSELTLKQACERYIERKERQGRSPETIRSYDVILRNRFQGAMSKKVSSIKNWQELYDKDARSHSPKTMNNAWCFVKTVCKEECGITLPEIDVRPTQKKEHLFLEPDQIKAFVAAIKGNKYEIPMLLGLCSCRASEIRAITWDKVDLKNNRILIKGAVVYGKNNQKIEKPENKTKDSERYIPIFIPQLSEALRSVEDKTGHVVTASKEAVYRQVNTVCKQLGFPEVGMHGLRHSFASLAYSLNVPIKIAMQLGGWSDYNTMVNIYTHLAKRDIEKYSKEISGFFENANENANAAENP